MSTDHGLRSDATRNATRILHAAREGFAEVGPDVRLDEIARRAQVGTRTLYRRFPTREALVRAALDQSIRERLAPAVEVAMEDQDPVRALSGFLGATLEMVSAESSILDAARAVGVLDGDVSGPFLATLETLVARAQAAGVVRADLEVDDLHRIMGMLTSIVWSMDPKSRGWERYVALMIDGLRPSGASALPPLVPLGLCARAET